MTRVIPQVDTSVRSVHTSDRKGVKPTIIVLHHTAGTNSLAYLTKNSAQASTHALIPKSGKIYRMVPDEVGANTVGFSAIGNYSKWPTLKGIVSCNRMSLNIEIENRGDGKDLYTAEQINATAWQIVQWRKKYGYLFLLSHQVIDTNGKVDPLGFNWFDLDKMVALHMGYTD
jgi:N-acetyl-anhydromuramyl-L-alanine amidase AmpD